MTQMIQTKHRFGILVEFTYNIAFQTRFENSSGNTTHAKSGPNDHRKDAPSFRILINC